MKKSCFLLSIWLMTLVFFFQPAAYGDPQVSGAEPCATALAIQSPTLPDRAQVVVFSAGKTKASALRLHLPSPWHWPDNSRAPAVITPPESVCQVSLCEKSACSTLFVINSDAFSEHPQPVTHEVTRHSPLPASGIFPLWMNHWVSGTGPFVPITVQNRGPDPEFSHPYRADLNKPSYSVREVYLAEQKQPLFLIHNPVDYRLYWLYWNEMNQFDIIQWPLLSPLENDNDLLNPNNLTLGIADQTRLNEPALLRVPLKREWLDTKQGSFRHLLPLLALIFGDVLQKQTADGSTEYWFRDHEGQTSVISQEELEQWHSLYHESIKADIFHRLTTGNPMNQAAGIAPAQFQREHRIVPWSIIRQIKKAIGRQAIQVIEKKPDNQTPPDSHHLQPPTSAGQQQTRQREVSDAIPGVLGQGWQQRMLNIQSSREFIGTRERPKFHEETLQVQIDHFVYASQTGSTDDMLRIVNTMETNEQKQSLLEGRYRAFPWLTALQAAVKANQQKAINLIRETADSINPSLFPELTRANEDCLPKQAEASATSNFPTNSFATNSNALAGAVGSGPMHSFLDSCAIPGHLLQIPHSSHRQCSEGRTECAVHEGTFDATVFLPCCESRVCEASLLSAMLALFSDSIVVPTLETVSCPVCTQPLNLVRTLSDAINTLQLAQEGGVTPAQVHSLNILTRISKHLKERSVSIDQLNRHKAVSAECNICFTEAECYQLPGCEEAGCAFCLQCLSQHIRIAYTSDDAYLLTEKGLQCPGCTAQVPDDVIKLLSGNSALQEITLKANQLIANRSPYLMSCPNGHLVDSRKAPGTRVVCPECNHSLCRQCRQDYHTGECPETLAFTQLIEENPLDYKRCPTCQLVVSKDEACNKVICSRCKTAFCWLCREDITGDYYQHFQYTSCLLHGGNTLQSAASAPTDNSMLNRCPICKTRHRLDFLLCGHTCCSDCENDFYRILEQLEYEFQRRCPLCTNEIDKQQEELPNLTIPPDARPCSIPSLRFTIYENHQGYYLVVNSDRRQPEKGFYLDKKDCLDQERLDELRVRLGVRVRGNNANVQVNLPFFPEGQPLLPCSFCDHVRYINEEGLCGDCQRAFYLSLQSDKGKPYGL
ncbi:IBR domain-containing protein [Endozoicomonas lisbonensis]|uniref:RING-type domain-containing protein n=1 Tax=Endozoicomonas lisbonensis TaxID=3120522 RepID=A0ABV2SB38_9GAMM